MPHKTIFLNPLAKLVDLYRQIKALPQLQEEAKNNRIYREWEAREFAPPSPGPIKQKVLIRNGNANAIWVETGTYLGETTELLSRYAKRVISIEPEPTLFQNAQAKFSTYSNVEIIQGVSEDIFPNLLPTLSGDINFWLDGHSSLGNTFSGPLDTPIAEELKNISENQNRFGKISILVDDIRHFKGQIVHYGAYPRLEFLVEWAQKNSFEWHIEHNIFIAKNYSL